MPRQVIINTPINSGSGTTATAAGAMINSMTSDLYAGLWTGVFCIDNYSPHADGVTDDTTALNAAITACVAAGGGTVLIGPHQYALTSANINVPSYVKLAGQFWPGNRNLPEDFTTTPFTLVLGGAYTINLGWNAAIENLIVRRSGMTVLSGIRQMINALAAFTGTGVTINGHDTHIMNMLIVGFSQGIYGTGFARHVIENVFIDCTNAIVIDNNHDTTHIHNAHMWQYVTGNLANRFVAYNISSAGTNGAGGLYRLTIAAHAFVTGDTAYVTGVGGAVGANGAFTVAVVDSTHIDLQGSAIAPATTATWVSGSQYLTLAAIANIAVGQTITGTNIPGSTTVTEVHLASSHIKISNATTGVGSATAVNFSNPPYTSGGTATLSANSRSGAAITVTNSESVFCTNFFEAGWKTGIHVGDLAGWCFFSNFGVDVGEPGDLGTIGILVDGGSYSSNFVNGQITNKYTQAIVVNSTGVTGHAFTNVALSAADGWDILQAISGRAILSHCSTSSSQANKLIWVADTIASLILSSNDLPVVKLSFQSTTGQIATNVDSGNNFIGGSPMGGIGTTGPLVITNVTNSEAIQIKGGQASAHDRGVEIKFSNTYAALDTYLRQKSNGALQFLDSTFAITLLQLFQDGGATIGTPTSNSQGAGSINVQNGFYLNGVPTVVLVAPTIASGFGSGASVVAHNGPSAFSINVGTGGSNTGVITLPTAPNGWTCIANDVTNAAAHATQQTGSTTTTVTIKNYVRTTGVLGNWADSDIISLSCWPY